MKINEGNSWGNALLILKHKESKLLFVGDRQKEHHLRSMLCFAELSGITGLEEEEESLSRPTPK